MFAFSNTAGIITTALAILLAVLVVTVYVTFDTIAAAIIDWIRGKGK